MGLHFSKEEFSNRKEKTLNAKQSERKEKTEKIRDIIDYLL